MAFEVASVKLSKATFTPPNFPLDSGDAFTNMRTKEPPRGRFKADFPLMVYILFAYKLTSNSPQMESIRIHLPKSIANDHFSIEARAEDNPTKDQMRLMMQSLLAERFKLAFRFESQEVPEFALTLVKPGKTGPKLIPHAEGPPCDSPTAEPSSGSTTKGGDAFPPVCDVYAMMFKPSGVNRLGSRNTTMDLLASSISGQAGRTVVDRTSLIGRFDFVIEYARELTDPTPPDKELRTESEAPTFLEALREQLGLKLESTKGSLQILVIDSVERPSEN